ncbi:aspartyl/asparaginyl beta-hydroxylase domain-containing protein [Sandaracinobacteroides saxicola]|uniref:Aspartyl/asparaginyl beta-hydroxylase domain-containing protein n=1 Tax=Sandaracinobacteroides saxicola TaxID=2759707 RepID=A0A7G5IJS7_9SPHN|nr:aspartyl/asparaginyl beta-hydroxylase domain-containing protein [Sandaracinobacteroides saxicola]QMW23619.1 aspartyl/asparaginyl beta-hydroxylase domain-containing protein [Sandaracinobacteroides saxicola]
MSDQGARIARFLADAERLAAAGQHADAHAVLERVLALDPDNPRALNTLALRALNVGRDPARARAMLERAVARDPGAAALRLNLADACRAGGDRAAELAALEGALALDPYLVPALIRKAQALEATGGPAVPVWKAVLATTPPGPERPPALAAVLAHAARQVAADGEATWARIAPALAAARTAETARVDHAVEHLLGRKRIYLNAPTGLHVPKLPADEFFAESHFPWLAGLEAAAAGIRAEGAALLAEGGGFAPYVAYAPGTPVNQWAELNHSPRWGAQFLWRDGVANAALQARCPATVAALAAIPRLDIPGRGPTAFFSLLAPKTRIPPHTGVTNARAIVHLALVVPEGCRYRVGSEERRWVEGRAFVFDDSIEHEAVNDSDETRLVLIFDVWNPWLGAAERDMLRALFPALDAHRGGGTFGG